jgi:AcrR family transcriptional regulator
MHQTLNLRDRKRIKARQTLADAAVDLFEAKGFDETTVAEIARAADMSPRTFFRYFGSKEDALFSRTPGYIAVVRDCLLHRPAEETRFEAIRGVLLEYADFLESRKSWIVRRARLIGAHPSLRGRSADFLNSWNEGLARSLATRAGLPEPSDDDRLAVSVGLSIFASAYKVWVIGDDARPLPTLLRDSYAVVTREVCTSEDRK